MNQKECIKKTLNLFIDKLLEQGVDEGAIRAALESLLKDVSEVDDDVSRD
jgi:hypothetical protein